MARCKRNRNQRSARSFSFLLLFQSASLLEYLYPGRCPGLYSYWAFSPSLLSASTLVRCHGYTPVGLSARLCSQHQLVCSAMVIRLLGFQPAFARNINWCAMSWLYAVGLSARLCSQHQLVCGAMVIRCCSFEENPKCKSNTLFALSVCDIDLQPFHATSLE